MRFILALAIALLLTPALARADQAPAGTLPKTAHAGFTCADLAAKLLRDIAISFRDIGNEPQNRHLKKQMDENASVYEEVATLLEKDPLGSVAATPQTPADRSTYAIFAADLLRSAATFFRNIGNDPRNPHVKEQMNKNAYVYDMVAALVEKDPLAPPGNPTPAPETPVVPEGK